MAASKPKQAYFGPKDPITGERPEEAPQYVHVSLPVILYHPEWDGWPRAGRQYDSMDDVAEALSKGWVRNPMEKGILTEPSREQAERTRIDAFNKATGNSLPLPADVAVVVPVTDEIAMATQAKKHEKEMKALREANADLQARLAKAEGKK